MQELTFDQVEAVSGGQAGCSLPSLGTVAAGFGVGGGAGITAGAATGYSAIATAYGIIGTALAGSFMAGFAIGVGINHAIGACEP